MAKSSPPKNGTARIRFIMLDAELPEGDLSQITTAIQNALKPHTTIIQQRLPPQAPLEVSNSPQNILTETEQGAIEPDDEAHEETPAPRKVREARVRKITTPKVIDLDLVSEVSFKNFVDGHPPKNDTERNLVILAWFKDHRNDEPVTMNHVYTCYRSMKWPTAIDDFSGTLRSLKSAQLVKSSGRGQYNINHLGMARVEKMSAP